MPNLLWLLYPGTYEICFICAGTGKEDCTDCDGSGGRHETRYDDDDEGRATSREEYISCGSCGGSGERTCSKCNGSGSIQKLSSGTDREFGNRPDPTPSSTHEEES